MNILKNKKILIVIGIFVVALVAYALMRDSSNTSATGVVKQAVSSNTVTTAGGSAASTLDGPGKEFVAQLLAIQNINFNLDFFTDSVFTGLQDWSRPINPQESGRPNPFAPIGDDSRDFSPQTPEQAVQNISAGSISSTVKNSSTAGKTVQINSVKTTSTKK
jgi:hypothetical protein